MESVSNVSEWLTLPKLDVPDLKNEKEDGRVYSVIKVGMLVADPDECKGSGVNVSSNPHGKCVLPTCVIEEGGKQHLCQVPLDLGEWAETVVGLANMGGNPFPCKVEFGNLQGRVYAELL